MIEDLRKLLDICEQYSEQIGEQEGDNEDLKDLKEDIECYLDKDYQKLLSAVELFEKAIILEDNAEEQYSQFYQQMLSSMASFATYFDDFHKVLFRLNKKRNLIKEVITLTEYQASDILEITYDDE